MAVIGFSTGAIAFDDFATALNLLEPTQATAVELSALRSVELAGLLSALPKMLRQLRQRYSYISFHAPTNFADEAATVDQLVAVAEMGVPIVVHPDTIHTPVLWKRLGAKLCVENMDSRKAIGRTADELTEYFDALPEAGLCFDIAHARQVDSTMSVAAGILKMHGHRLIQTHISEINSRGTHFMMSSAALRAFGPFAKMMARAPVILESIARRPDEIERELAQTERLLLDASRRPVSRATKTQGGFTNPAE